MRRTTIASLVALVAIGFVATLFVVQNSARTTQLSLDLGFAAWQLADPVPMPALIGVCFLLGAAIGGAVMGVRASRLARRVRALERQVALGTGTTGASDGYRR